MVVKHNSGFSRLVLFLLLTFLLGVASTASATKSLATYGAISHKLRRTKTFQFEMQETKERKLPGIEIDISQSLKRLFATAPEAWTTGQWIFAALILLVALWCCGCLACGRRYHRGGYNYYRRSSSGGGGLCACLQNLLMCFCCYELCCRNCQDVPCCNDNAAGEYYRQGDVV